VWPKRVGLDGQASLRRPTGYASGGRSSASSDRRSVHRCASTAPPIGAILLTPRPGERLDRLRCTDHRSPRRRGGAGHRARPPSRGRDGEGPLEPSPGWAMRPHLLAVIDKELARPRAGRAHRAEHGRHRRPSARSTTAGALRSNHVLETFANVLRSILRREDSAARSVPTSSSACCRVRNRDQAPRPSPRAFSSDSPPTPPATRSRAIRRHGVAGIAVSPSDSQDVGGLLDAARVSSRPRRHRTK